MGRPLGRSLPQGQGSLRPGFLIFFTGCFFCGAPQKKQPVKKIKKPGRNDPCPCGKLRPNGLPMKYKDCCGRNE